jgi:hypothetical protein
MILKVVTSLKPAANLNSTKNIPRSSFNTIDLVVRILVKLKVKSIKLEAGFAYVWSDNGLQF